MTMLSLLCRKLIILLCFFPLGSLHVSLGAEEPNDELAEQLGCAIDFHKIPTQQPKSWVIPEQMTVRVTDVGKNPLAGANVCLDFGLPDEPA